MDENTTTKPYAAGSQLNQIGAAVTAMWLGAIAIYTWLNWAKVVALEPNTFGDALAGAFAPLAFFWLVLGFFQQGAELRNSGKALWLQGEELRNSVEQQRDLVNVTREQLDFESRRISNENAQRWRRSQPDLELNLGGSAQSGVDVIQQFKLINHGRTCTKLVINFHGRTSNIHFSKLDTGEEKKFQFNVSPSEVEDFQVDVTYIDQDLGTGRTAFHILGKFPQFGIVRESAILDAAETKTNEPSSG